MPDLIGIIGGTGADLHAAFDSAQSETVATKWGEALVTRASPDGHDVVFLHRHTPRHDVPLPPHAVNYRANIAAMKSLGVTAILASFAVGSMRTGWPPGSLVLLSDFIDFTSGRQTTFFDHRAVHADATTPFCPRLRALLSEAANDLGHELHNGGSYLCTNGPRFETPAEIRMFSQWADLVGMTLCPEICLAREANISYAGLAVVTNFAAGLMPQALTLAEVLEVMEPAKHRVKGIFMNAVSRYRDDPTVQSRRVTEEYGSPSVLD